MFNRWGHWELFLGRRHIINQAQGVTVIHGCVLHLQPFKNMWDDRVVVRWHLSVLILYFTIGWSGLPCSFVKSSNHRRVWPLSINHRTYLDCLAEALEVVLSPSEYFPTAIWNHATSHYIFVIASNVVKSSTSEMFLFRGVYILFTSSNMLQRSPALLKLAVGQPGSYTSILLTSLVHFPTASYIWDACPVLYTFKHCKANTMPLTCQIFGSGHVFLPLAALANQRPGNP